MAVSLSGTIQLLANIIDSRTAVSGAAKETGTRSIGVASSISIVSGTAAGQVDKVWADTRTVALSATDSLDFAGVLTDSFGVLFSPVKIRAILIVAATANVSTLQITRPAANGLVLFGAASGNLASIGAGGAFYWQDLPTGVAVTTGTGDLLSVINSAGGQALYDIAVLGTSV